MQPAPRLTVPAAASPAGVAARTALRQRGRPAPSAHPPIAGRPAPKGPAHASQAATPRTRHFPVRLGPRPPALPALSLSPDGRTLQSHREMQPPPRLDRPRRVRVSYRLHIRRPRGSFCGYLVPALSRAGVGWVVALLPPDVTPAEAGPGAGWRWSSCVAATSSPSPYSSVCALRQGRTSGGERKRWPSLLPAAPAVSPKESFQMARWLGGPS